MKILELELRLPKENFATAETVQEPVQKNPADEIAPAGFSGGKVADQINNSRKVVVPPFQHDTISVHPDALKKAAEENQIDLSPVDPVKKIEPSEPVWWEQLHDLSRWVWGLVNVVPPSEVVTGEKSTDTVDPASSTAGPQVKLFIDEMKQLLNRIKDLQEEEVSQQLFDELLVSILKEQARHKEDEMAFSREKLITAQKEKIAINKERSKKLQDVIEFKATSSVWGKFEKTASSVGLVATAATVSTPMSAIAFLVGLGMVADQLLDSPAKKFLASIISANDSSKQERWVNYMELGAGLAVVALTLGLGGASSFQSVASITQGTASGIKGVHDYKMNHQNADLLELENRSTKSSDQAKKELGTAKKIVEGIHEHYRIMSDIAKNQLEASLSIVRR